MLYWGLSFQKPTTMSNSLSSQESCTGKQVNEAQSINQLVEKKPIITIPLKYLILTAIFQNSIG